MDVTIMGAGVAGLACAIEFAERGAHVEVLERGSRLGPQSCSWYAGGMLAPWCEREHGGPLVTRLGAPSIDWWSRRFPGTVRNGTLVVAHGRDVLELVRFARHTDHYEWLDRERIGELEPDLCGRFDQALYFPREAHLDPRAALPALAARLEALGGRIRYQADTAPASGDVVDCTGLAARDAFSDLRGVKGEMLLLRSRDVSLRRPVRILHPRLPLYVVPRGPGLFMVGATMIESGDHERVSARSVLELLTAAYALHPAFGEAEVVELGTQARPAFRDNLPKIRRRGRVLYVNGLYRHGFLLAPALARGVTQMVLQCGDGAEAVHDDPCAREWQWV